MKQTKKGFTLVELLVVIAILAILATVSVVGYTSFITRANLSNDQATIAMINRNLQAEFVTGKPESAGEALTALGGLGFTDEKLVPYSANYHYAYHLESNTFYLVDNNDTIVYPENASVDKSELWGLYHDDSSYIAGVNQYVALNPVTSHEKFVLAFAPGSYYFDLNQNYIAFHQPQGYQINISNGYVAQLEQIAGSTSYPASETVVSMQVVDGTAGKSWSDIIASAEVVSGEKVIKDKLFVCTNENKAFRPTAGTKESVRFQNCVFACVAVDDAIRFNSFTNLIIDGCTFLDSSASAIHIEYLYGKLTITNSKFIGCARGIHIGACAEGSLIQGNTFNITTTDNNDGYAIRLDATFHDIDDGKEDSYIHTPAQGAAIAIKDNNFEYCYAPIVLRKGFAEGQKYQLNTSDPEYKHLIECSNNTFGTIHSNEKVVYSKEMYNWDDVKAYFEGIIK